MKLCTQVIKVTRPLPSATKITAAPDEAARCAARSEAGCRAAAAGTIAPPVRRVSRTPADECSGWDAAHASVCSMMGPSCAAVSGLS